MKNNKQTKQTNQTNQTLKNKIDNKKRLLKSLDDVTKDFNIKSFKEYHAEELNRSGIINNG